MLRRYWNVLPRWLRLLFTLAFCGFVLLVFAAGGLWWYFHPAVTRTNGIVYGQRGEHNLTFDIIRPRHPNGLAVAFMVSGSWKSQGPGKAPEWIMAPLLRRGYTLFALCHVSQPEASVMEIIEDVNRGIRFIRHHAEEYEIDPDHLGVSGGSSGGHLCLMLATRGSPGPAESTDPVDRESSAVQAVAVFFPVTDLLNLGESTENPGDGGPPKSFVKAFGPKSTDLAIWKEIGHETSPIYYITDKMPPVLIYHGDADTLVPLDQSVRFRDRAQELGRRVELVVHKHGEHGWPTMIFDVFKFADWFDRYLPSD